MKIRADENVSPKIVRALREVILSAGWELSHVRDDNAPRTADETWIPRFAANGGKGIISADTAILKRPHQIEAIRASGVIGIFLDPRWAGAKRHQQAAHLIWHWPAIEGVMERSVVGDCWSVPFDFGKSKITAIKVDYEKARIAAKRGAK